MCINNAHLCTPGPYLRVNLIRSPYSNHNRPCRITSVLYYLRCQVHLFSKIHSAFNFYSKKDLFEPFPNVRDSVFSHYPLLGSLNRHDSDGSENVIQKVNLLCLNHDHSPYFISFIWPNVD